MNVKLSFTGFIALIYMALLPSNSLMANKGQKKGIDLSFAGDIEIHLVYGNDFQIKYEGYIVLTENDKEIVSISPNGYLEVKKVTFGSMRSVKITSDSKGHLTKAYFEGRNEKDYQSYGKQWLADILPTIVRNSGVGAEFRVKRIYAKQGIEGVLHEIDLIEDNSGALRNLYFIIAVQQLRLSESDIDKMLPQMENIASNSKKGTLMRELLDKYKLSDHSLELLLETTATLDYNTERGSVLRVYNKQFNENEDLLDAYFDIIEEMSINSEKGNVLKDLMATQKLSNNTWIRLFNSLESFSLMRERGAILSMAIDYMPQNKEVLDAFNDAVEDIDRDYYVLKGEILDALIDAQSGINGSRNLSADLLVRLLISAEEISSNSKKGEILRKVNKGFISEPEVIEAYQETVSSMSNNIEVYNVLLDLIRKNKLDKKAFRMVLELTEELVSDDYQHAAGAVLRACIEKMPNDKDLMNSMFEILQDMDQNSTIEEVLRLISQNDKFNKDGFIISRVIETTKSIDVDIEIVSVLTSLEYFDKNSSEQLIPFKYAVEKLEWEYFRRRMQDWVN